MNKHTKQNHAFTLIELLVVIAIIGILAAVVLSALNTARVKAKEKATIYQMQQLQKEMILALDSENIPVWCEEDCISENGYRFTDDSNLGETFGTNPATDTIEKKFLFNPETGEARMALENRIFVEKVDSPDTWIMTATFPDDFPNYKGICIDGNSQMMLYPKSAIPEFSQQFSQPAKVASFDYSCMKSSYLTSEYPFINFDGLEWYTVTRLKTDPEFIQRNESLVQNVFKEYDLARIAHACFDDNPCIKPPNFTGSRYDDLNDFINAARTAFGDDTGVEPNSDLNSRLEEWITMENSRPRKERIKNEDVIEDLKFLQYAMALDADYVPSINQDSDLSKDGYWQSANDSRTNYVNGMAYFYDRFVGTITKPLKYYSF